MVFNFSGSFLWIQEKSSINYHKKQTLEIKTDKNGNAVHYRIGDIINEVIVSCQNQILNGESPSSETESLKLPPKSPKKNHFFFFTKVVS